MMMPKRERALWEFKHAPPSSPLRIEMRGGETLTVNPPDFVIISRRGDEAVVYARGESGHRALDLRQVVAVKSVQKRRKGGRR